MVSRGFQSVHAAFISFVLNTVSIKDPVFPVNLQLLSEAVRGEWRQASGLDRKTERETTVSQSDDPEACCDHVFELM